MRNFILLMTVFVVIPVSSSAQKVVSSSSMIRPVWVRNPASLAQARQKYTYEFKVVENAGPSLSVLEKDRLYALGNYLESQNSISGVIDRDYESVNLDGMMTDKISNTLKFRTETSVKTFHSMMIDNYWEQVDIPGIGLRYNYYTLYAVSELDGTADFDSFSTTEKYGCTAFWRSAIIPGWGQLYKGQKLKGGLVLGGCAVLATGIAVAEVMRQDNIRQISQTHAAYQIRNYAENVNNLATVRNICIGAAVALYVYGLIDAIVSPGARRIVVIGRDFGGGSLSVVPAIMQDGTAGIVASMNF